MKATNKPPYISGPGSKRVNRQAYDMLRSLSYIKVAEIKTGLIGDAAYPKALSMFMMNMWGINPNQPMKVVLDFLDTVCSAEQVGKYARRYAFCD